MPWQFWIDPQHVAEQATNIKDSAPVALPFLMTTASGATKLSIPRIIEAVIIAAVSGGITMWVTVSVLSSELSHVKASMVELKAELRELRRDVYVHMLNEQASIQKTPPH